MGFSLLNCSNNAQTIITSTDLSGYAVVTLEEYPDICWTVTEVEPTGDPVTLVNCYPNCEECLRIAYRLTDCTGRLLPRYSTQEEFADLLGKIVKVPYYDNACFTVDEIQYSATDYEYENIEYSNSYNNCSACRERKTVYPNYTPVCDLEKFLKTICTYSEILHQQVISKRFGVTTCCPDDLTKWSIKNWLLQSNLLNHLSPDLPEPFVEACCIDKFGTNNTCNTSCSCGPYIANCACENQNSCGCSSNIVSNCSCEDQNSCGCNSQTVSNCSCGYNSKLTCNCYTYKFNIVAGMLADAIGNTDTTQNNTVYARYTPCGEIGKITVPYIEVLTAETLCSIKVPELFWYKNDVETVFDSITGGNLKKCGMCEPVHCPCSCTASECSPHDCHTYTFTVEAEMLADATGNTETELNNKVYFGYIPCSKTCSVTENYTVVGDQEYCVLGIPILGWYKNDIWVNYDSIPEGNLTRGNVCEVDNNCDGCCTIPCNTCNTCNR